MTVLIGVADATDQTAGAVFLVMIIAYWYMGFAIAAKRWHDRNRSGLMTLIVFVPLFGPMWMLIDAGILEGTRGPNKFGADPRAQVPL